MKRTFLLKGLCCANCAAKMERLVSKIDGISEASISFMTQKLTLEADDAHFEEILEQAAQICRKVEPDCRIIK